MSSDAPVASNSILDFIQDETARENLGLIDVEEENVDETTDFAAEEQEAEIDPKYFPKEFWGTLKGHNKTVTAFAVHPKGARLASGGADQLLCLWDLASQSPYPFRQSTPAEGYGVREIGWSLTGGHLAVATGDSVIRILDSDGGSAAQTYRGVPQVLDASKTEGHNYGAGTLAWSPFNRENFISGSLDGTVRVWDITSRPKGIDEALPHVQCFKAAGSAGGRIRTGITVVRYLPTSCRTILGASTDGGIHMWDFDRKYSKSHTVMKAHDGEITGMEISLDDNRVFTRGQDDTMKMWDLRRSKAPVHIWPHLNNSAVGVGICLSADESLVVTPHGNEVAAFDPTTGELVHTLKIPNVRAIAFPGSLRQIIAGDKDGIVSFYGGESSKKVKPMDWRDSRKVSSATEAVNIAVYTMEDLPAGIKATRDGEIRMLRGYRLKQERQEREPRSTQQMPPVNKRARKESWRKPEDDDIRRF